MLKMRWLVVLLLVATAALLAWFTRPRSADPPTNPPIVPFAVPKGTICIPESNGAHGYDSRGFVYTSTTEGIWRTLTKEVGEPRGWHFFLEIDHIDIRELWVDPLGRWLILLNDPDVSPYEPRLYVLDVRRGARLVGFYADMPFSLYHPVFGMGFDLEFAADGLSAIVSERSGYEEGRCWSLDLSATARAGSGRAVKSLSIREVSGKAQPATLTKLHQTPDGVSYLIPSPGRCLYPYSDDQLGKIIPPCPCYA